MILKLLILMRDIPKIKRRNNFEKIYFYAVTSEEIPVCISELDVLTCGIA